MKTLNCGLIQQTSQFSMNKTEVQTPNSPFWASGQALVSTPGGYFLMVAVYSPHTTAAGHQIWASSPQGLLFSSFLVIGWFQHNLKDTLQAEAHKCICQYQSGSQQGLVLPSFASPQGLHEFQSICAGTCSFKACSKGFGRGADTIGRP